MAVAVRFGLFLPNQGELGDPRLLASLGRSAELAGWDGLFLWDTLLRRDPDDPLIPLIGDSGMVADPLVALTAVAANTERLMIGALVTPVARWRPEGFALATATLDRLSGGRLVVGVGLGSTESHFSAFGHETDAATRAAIVDEFLEVLALLWSGEQVNFDGAHFHVHGISMTPPRGGERIPVWIGAYRATAAPRRRAARWDGFVPASPSWPSDVISADEYSVSVEAIRHLRQGDAPFDVVVIGNVDATAPTRDELARYEAAGVTWALTQAFNFAEATERIAAGPPDGTNA